MKISHVAMTTLALAVLLAARLPAADKLPAYNSIRAAGPDFAVQGEYVGTVGGSYPVGIQIVALLLVDVLTEIAGVKL